MDKIKIVYTNGIKFFKGKGEKLYLSKEAAKESFKLKDMTRRQYRKFVLGN